MRLSCLPATSPNRRSDPSGNGRSHSCACKSPRLPARHFPRLSQRGRTSLLHCNAAEHLGCFRSAAGPPCCYFRAARHVGCSHSEAGHLSCFRLHARLSLVAISRPRTHAGHGRRRGRMLNDLFVFVDEELRRNVQSSWSTSIYNRVVIRS